jgi:hypothetical protein
MLIVFTQSTIATLPRIGALDYPTVFMHDEPDEPLGRESGVASFHPSIERIQAINVMSRPKRKVHKMPE